MPNDTINVAEGTYQQIKARAIGFTLRPGERINEGALAKNLGVSRTPLREALNRLVSEQLIDFTPGKGFFCRPLDPRAIFELYEMRLILEDAAVRRAVERADDAAIGALKDDLYANGLAIAGKTIREVTQNDENFHIGIARLADNAELVRQLEQINDRIRFIRWIDMASRVNRTKGDHKRIIAAIEDRNADLAAESLRDHIALRMDQVIAAVKEGISSLYLTDPEELFAHPLDGPQAVSEPDGSVRPKETT